MNETLKLLYNALSEQITPKNPLSGAEPTEHFNRIVDAFRERKGGVAETDSFCEMLSDLCETTRQAAFETGFRTAVRLLTR